jgi:hypothetical protein
VSWAGFAGVEVVKLCCRAKNFQQVYVGVVVCVRGEVKSRSRAFESDGLRLLQEIGRSAHSTLLSDQAQSRSRRASDIYVSF